MKKIKTFKPKEIDITNFNQVRNYAASFKVTVEELKKAIDKVGPKVDDLTRHLKAYYNPYTRRTKGWRL